MPILLQLAQSYSNPDSVNYKLAYLREQMEQQLLNLGDLAYEDQVQLAMLGDTIIIGGFLRTELIAAKSILAHHLNVNELSSITANIGEVTAGILKSSDGQSYFDLNNNKIKTNNAEITGGTIDIRTDSADRSIIVLSYDGGSYGEDHITLSPSMMGVSNYKKNQNFIQGALVSDDGVHVYEGISYDGIGASVQKEIRVESDRITIFDVNGEPAGYQVFLGRNSSQLRELTNSGTLTTNNLTVSGTKNRVVKTENYGKVLHYSLETPTPMFMDVGHGVISEDGLCYVDMEQIFSETVDLVSDYHVQLTKYGQGDVWVAERQSTYFVVQGTPGLKFSWEVKAKQKGYSNERLEKPEESKEGYETDYIRLADEYLINYMKELIAV